MAQPQLRARFFVDRSGVVIQKASVLPRRTLRKIYDRDGGKCTKCGAKVARYGHSVYPGKLSAAVDHIFPRARGGQNEETNLRLLCICCNSQKGAK